MSDNLKWSHLSPLKSTLKSDMRTYNSLFLRVLGTGDGGPRFNSSAGRSFPSESNVAFSSRIIRLLALSERGQKNKQPSLEDAKLDHFWHICVFFFSFKLLRWDTSETGGRLNKKQTMENRVLSQISESKGIISYIFFGLADQTSRTEQREHIHISLLYLLTWESCQPPWRVD